MRRRKPIRQITAIQASCPDGFETRKLNPSTPSVTIIPAMPTSNSGRRPARSTKNIATIVMPTFTTPTPDGRQNCAGGGIESGGLKNFRRIINHRVYARNLLEDGEA